MSGYRTPLGRARGLGSAKHGVGHWISERVTAVLLIPLVVWVIWAALTLARADYASAVTWLRAPVNAVLLSLLTAISFWHMHGGMRVVVEDYIAKPSSKAVLLILNLVVCGLTAAAAVFCILKVALGGSAS
jgi:succinate dehydrogenase / fumarate reductase membrane anchor subunit